MSHITLNQVISKMVWVKLWYLNFQQLTSLNWLLQLQRHPYPAHLYAFQDKLTCFLANKTNSAFVVISWWNENKRTASTNEALINWQSNVCRKSKCTLQSFLELHGMRPDTKLLLSKKSEMNHFVHSFSASKQTHFLNLLLLLPAALEELMYEITFFVSVWCHDNFILHQNGISVSMTQKCGLDWTLVK